MAESKIDLALRALLVLVRHELSGDHVEELQSIEQEIASAASRFPSGGGKASTITVMIKGDASGLKDDLETVRVAAEATAPALSGVSVEFKMSAERLEAMEASRSSSSDGTL